MNSQQKSRSLLLLVVFFLFSLQVSCEKSRRNPENVTNPVDDDPHDDYYVGHDDHRVDFLQHNDLEILKNHEEESQESADDDGLLSDEEWLEQQMRLFRRHQQRRRRIIHERLRRKKFAKLSKWRRPSSFVPPRPRRVVFAKRPRQNRLRHFERSDFVVEEEEVEVEEEAYPDHVPRAESTSVVRSLLGVNPFCVEEDAQFSCTFTPLCWMSGGVAKQGCDSMLYSCCVSPTIASRKDNVGTGRAQKRRWKEVKEVLHNEPECGVTKHRQFAKRIIGGHKAKFAELPWQVHIRISSYQCGGVLLNNLYVATAAHCVHQAELSQITVHLGEYDTKDTENVKEPLDSESFRVKHITLHPDFRYMLTQPDRFDIALLKLDHPVEYRDNILPICLPTFDYDLQGKMGVVAGWGKTDNSFGKTGTNLLHKVLVPIIANRRCRSWHRDKAIAVQLHDEMFCAGHKGGKQDACLGDSGGPLVINFDGRWTLIGITSAGFGCAVEKQPGIYHKVSKTSRWISQQINQP